MAEVAPAGHYPREPYDPAQGWHDPVPTTLTCGCGLTFTGMDLADACQGLNLHQREVVPPGTVMNTAGRPLPADAVCELCEDQPATRVVMGPCGPYEHCGNDACS